MPIKGECTASQERTVRFLRAEGFATKYIAEITKLHWSDVFAILGDDESVRQLNKVAYG